MPEYRKKLIEVALSLETINKESIHENYIYNPHSAVSSRRKIDLLVDRAKQAEDLVVQGLQT